MLGFAFGNYVKWPKNQFRFCPENIFEQNVGLSYFKLRINSGDGLNIQVKSFLFQLFLSFFRVLK